MRDAVPVCGDAKVKYEELSAQAAAALHRRAGARSRAPAIRCDGAVRRPCSPPPARSYLGTPWPIADEEGKTVEEKLKNFTWRNMHENMTATIDRTRNADGLFPVTLHQTTENGKMPLTGFVDAGRPHLLLRQLPPARRRTCAPQRAEGVRRLRRRMRRRKARRTRR